MSRIDADSVRWATRIADRMTRRPHLREEFASAALEGLVRADRRYDGRIPWLKYVSVEVTAAIRAEIRAWDLAHWRERARIQRGEALDIEEETFRLDLHDRDDLGANASAIEAKLTIDAVMAEIPLGHRRIIHAIYFDGRDAREAERVFSKGLGFMERKHQSALDLMRNAA